MGGACPGGSVSILRMHDAALFRNGKSLLFANLCHNLLNITLESTYAKIRITVVVKLLSPRS